MKLLWACSAFLLAACTPAGSPVSFGTEPTATPSPSMALVPTMPNGDLAPVSISNLSAGARDAFAKCHIGDQYSIEHVVGMAQVPLAKDLLHYVPLTGREPQLREDGPAWVIQLRGDTPQRGGELWTDPVCVVTARDFGFFATGPVTDQSTGMVYPPEPPPLPPDRNLPPLVP